MASIDPSGSTPLPASTTAPESDPSTTALPQVVNVGTRKSLLARVQTDLVVAALKQQHPGHDFRIHAISTMGDKNQVTALHEFNAKALWTFELEKMLDDGAVDLIVHSLKDIPTQMAEHHALGAVLEREDPRDALVLHPALPRDATLSSLPANSTIGTSSVRRSAQLKRLYPHLRFQSVRGNVGTRLAKLDGSDLGLSAAPEGSAGSKQGEARTVDEGEGPKPHYAALILAAAGLIRLELGGRISRLFSSGNMEAVGGGVSRKGMLHAVGQGALGVQCRAKDAATLAMLAPLNHRPTRLRCLAERSLMRTLEGGCSVPIGVETEWAGGSEEQLTMRAIVVALDGLDAVETERTASIETEKEADQMGWDVARLLVDKGAKNILQSITLNRDIIKEDDNA